MRQPTLPDRRREVHRWNGVFPAAHPHIIFPAPDGQCLRGEARCFAREEEFHRRSGTCIFAGIAGTSSICYARNLARIGTPKGCVIIGWIPSRVKLIASCLPRACQLFVIPHPKSGFGMTTKKGVVFSAMGVTPTG